MRKFHHRVHFRPFRRSCDILTRVPARGAVIPVYGHTPVMAARAPKTLEVLPEMVEPADSHPAALSVSAPAGGND